MKQPPPLTVSQLTNAIKFQLETSFPSLHLQGEITNFKVQASGHFYFSLKDDQAQISVVMFKADASSLRTIPKGGDQVIVKGSLNVYPPKGNYQFVVRELAFVGIGELLQKLEALKIKLHQLGWFKSHLKKPLPRFPKRIGVVTSPTGAVIQDILHILNRRFAGFHLILNPVKVQGEGAAEEIAKAIEQFNQYQLVDVIIVGRGGGSLEDLWAFNEEIVASAIFHSKIPVISAVGHETDHCIADYVADMRAPTPSAAAEIVIAEKGLQIDFLKTISKRIHQALTHLLHRYRIHFRSLQKHPSFSNPKNFIELRMQKIDDMRPLLDFAIQQSLQFKKRAHFSSSQQLLSLKPSNLITNFRQKFQAAHRLLQAHLLQNLQEYTLELNYTKSQVDQKIIQQVSLYKKKLDHLSQLLKALDPKNVLKKGYTILFAENTLSVINSIQKLQPGQQARLLLSDGEALITIEQVIPK